MHQYAYRRKKCARVARLITSYQVYCSSDTHATPYPRQPGLCRMDNAVMYLRFFSTRVFPMKQFQSSPKGV